MMLNLSGIKKSMGNKKNIKYNQVADNQDKHDKELRRFK